MSIFIPSYCYVTGLNMSLNLSISSGGQVCVPWAEHWGQMRV